MKWHRYLGLPHVFGADPEDGVGCDCLIMTWNILAEAGVPHPQYQDRWLNLARQGEWVALKELWLSETVVCPQQEYALTLFEESDHLGLGIIVDDGLLFPHHKRGVHWLPNRKVAHREFRTFR